MTSSPVLRRCLLLLLLATLTRGLMLSAALPNPQRMLRRDAEGYIQAAQNLLAGHGFSLERQPPYNPTAFRTPLYPLFIAACYALFGADNRLLALVQVLLSLLTVVLAYMLGRKILPEAAAWLGGLLFALSSLPATHAVFILSETLFSLLLLLCLGCLVCYRQANRLRWLACAGGLAGLSLLCRPLALYFPVAFFPLAWLAAAPGRRRQAVSGALLALLVCALTLSPWLIRNQARLGKPIFTTISNYNLLVYNAASLQASLQGVSQSQARAALEGQAQQELTRRGVASDEVQMAQLYGEWGRRIILAHPLRYALDHLKNDLNSYLPDVTDFLELMGVTQGGKGTLSVLNQLGLWAAIRHYFGAQTWLLALTLPWLALLALTYLGGLCGLLVLLRRATLLRPATALRQDDRFTLAWLLLPILYFTLLPGAPSNPRFRLPVMPYLCLLAGLGCLQLARWLYNRASRCKEV